MLPQGSFQFSPDSGGGSSVELSFQGDEVVPPASPERNSKLAADSVAAKDMGYIMSEHEGERTHHTRGSCSTETSDVVNPPLG